jgi:murein L,D-transpeptidase YcbB/YkuD
MRGRRPHRHLVEHGSPLRRLLVGGAVVAAALSALSGCSSETQTPVEAAQAEVTAKEEALADAEAEATDAEREFCAASATYVTAVDRYGDVLHETAPTVGDVTEAGQDLADPKAETVDAGEAAVDAHEQVARAEKELADARAALAAAQVDAGQAPAEPAPDPTPTATRTVAPAVVTRVEQAETDFADAQAGITDETPLVQAAEQFNAAAVALEMAWLQLFAEAGCFAEQQQEQAVTAVRDYTVALQQALTQAGYYAGEVDGIYGPATVAAVEALQEANGLPQTGTLDKATDEALRAELAALGGAAAEQETATTAAIQQTLALAGYWDGPVDGRWTDELGDAVATLQADLGVPVTGAVDAATVAAFEQAIVDAMASPSPEATSTEPAAEPSPSP